MRSSVAASRRDARACTSSSSARVAASSAAGASRSSLPELSTQVPHDPAMGSARSTHGGGLSAAPSVVWASAAPLIATPAASPSGAAVSILSAARRSVLRSIVLPFPLEGPGKGAGSSGGGVRLLRPAYYEDASLPSGNPVIAQAGGWRKSAIAGLPRRGGRPDRACTHGPGALERVRSARPARPDMTAPDMTAPVDRSGNYIPRAPARAHATSATWRR